GNLAENFRLVKTDTVTVPAGDLPQPIVLEGVSPDRVVLYFPVITSIAVATGVTGTPLIDASIRYRVGASPSTVDVVLQLHNDGAKGTATYKVYALNIL